MSPPHRPRPGSSPSIQREEPESTPPKGVHVHEAVEIHPTQARPQHMGMDLIGRAHETRLTRAETDVQSLKVRLGEMRADVANAPSRAEFDDLKRIVRDLAIEDYDSKLKEIKKEARQQARELLESKEERAAREEAEREAKRELERLKGQLAERRQFQRVTIGTIGAAILLAFGALVRWLHGGK